MAILTDTKARNITAATKPVPHGGVTGLTLHPSGDKGQGKWVLRYVSPVTGKRRNAGLGTYPNVGIADAAKAALLMRELLNAGQDPLVEKASTASKAKVPNFQEAAQTLHGELTPGWKNVKHGQQWINTLTQYAFPHIGKMALDQIQPKHVADVLRPIWLDKAETASRLKQRIHAVMSWAWAHGYCQSNPVDVVVRLLPQQPGKAVRTEHQPAMPWQAIPKFWKTHLSVPEPRDLTRSLMKVLILTACRSGEVRGMRWSELDFDAAIWSIPAQRMKAKFSHRVPLSTQAVEIIKSQQGVDADLVFPSPRQKKNLLGTAELSDMVLTSFLRRVSAPSSTPGRVATAHGFRSSFRDWCSEKGYPRDLAERSLAHTVQNKVEAAYHRTDLLEQRRPLMQAWADYLFDEVW